MLAATPKTSAMTANHSQRHDLRRLTEELKPKLFAGAALKLISDSKAFCLWLGKCQIQNKAHHYKVQEEAVLA